MLTLLMGIQLACLPTLCQNNTLLTVREIIDPFNMEENTLQHLIYGRAITNEVPAETPDVLAMTDSTDVTVAQTLQQVIPLVPLPQAGILPSQSIALVAIDNPGVGDLGERVYVLARAHNQRDGGTLPVYQYIFLPPHVRATLGSDLDTLIKMINTPIPSYSVTQAPIDPLSIPAPAIWNIDKVVTLINGLLGKYEAATMTRLFLILDAMITQRALICNFPMSWRERINLVQVISALLPRAASYQLTFSTYAEQAEGTAPHLLFGMAQDDDSTITVDWSAALDAGDPDLQSAYARYLYAQWTGDIRDLLETIQHMNGLAMSLQNETLAASLEAIAVRHQQDVTISDGGNLPPAELLDVLNGGLPPQGDLLHQYLAQLLRHALNERDTETALMVSAVMDNDVEADKALNPVFVKALDDQPDDLYQFIRTRLSQGINEKWLVRLHAAASRSLELAVASGDSATLSSWLTLIGREPLRYELTDVLKKGLLAARELAAQSEELAQQLLVLAVKRQPDILPELLNDEQVRAPLPDHIRAVLDFDSEAIEAVADESRELFLMTLARALDESQACIRPTAIRLLWDIHTHQKTRTLPSQYRPVSIMQRTAHDDVALLDGAMETLLTLVLKDHDDELFFDLVKPLAEQERLQAVVVPALTQSGRTVDETLYIVSTLLSHSFVNPQTAVDIYVQMLMSRDWNDDALPLIEQLGRSLHQYNETHAPMNMLWRLAERSGELKNEQMLRASVRLILDDIGAMVAEKSVVENFSRLRKASAWSSNSKATLTRWWRNYTREQSLTQLQKLDRELEGKRHLEDVRAILQTTLALRRVLGGRSLTEFADAISTTYSTLQALANAFDPEGKAQTVVDSSTIRSEIAKRAPELPVDVRHVLATNLKDLAQLITALAENRSKGFMRSDNSVERQLVTGEQQPQSAIDVMRWLSGYLDGIQGDDEEEA